MSGSDNSSYVRPSVSVVIPVRNESLEVDNFIKKNQESLKSANEIIFVDGQSSDETLQKLNNIALVESSTGKFKIIASDPGRGKQMNTGAVTANSDVILFLHVDTVLPENGLEQIKEKIKSGELWGRFDVQLNDEQLIFRIIENMMNWRSTLTNIVTGDQGIFVRKDLFNLVGGYPEIPLMEDISFSACLREISPAKRIKSPVITSARRWQDKGIVRTIFLMWLLRFSYWLGISPEKLANWYGK